MSLFIRKRWLSLIGLAVLLAGVLLGQRFNAGWLALGALVLGLALLVIQIPIGVRSDLPWLRSPKERERKD